jgi:hypothetical protein
MNDKIARHTAEFDRLTCAIDETIDAFLRESSVLDDVDAFQALRVTGQTRQQRVAESGTTDWEEFRDRIFGTDGRGTE